MKNRVFTTLTILPFLLCSCGKDKYLGSYTFQMGKSSSTHMSINMVLGDRVIRDATTQEELGLYFSLKAEANIQDGESAESEYSFISDVLKDGLDIDGFYKIGKETDSGSKVMDVGFIIEDLEEETGIDLPISTALTSKLIYTEINDKQISVHAPVSFEDLMYQLYWYGLDVYINDQDEYDIKDVDAHETGTHPTAEDIAHINETYPVEHKDSKYRDFHTLTLPLLKD